jgi:HD-GYP domain-containing protein (c-di-GMP phosphodiesterase class II)
VGVEDAILKKPGKLDDAEYASMKRHTMLGAERIRGDDPYDAAAREVALHHHERWDGAGYPGRVDLAEASGDIARLLELPMPRTGLAGAEIPLFARIVSIADVFDALSSRRAYKEPWPEARILQAIRDDSGKAFDPELVDIFFERLDQVKAAWARHPDPTEAH